MERMDEKIIQLMNQMSEDTQPPLEESGGNTRRLGQNLRQAFVVIGNEHIPLEDRSILSDKLRIRIPKTFKVMPPQIASLKYPSEHRPGLIYTNTTASITIAFNYTSTPLVESEMKKFTEAITLTLKKTQPAAEWIGDGISESNGLAIGYCEFITPAIDTEIYQLMFFISLEGKALLCTFNCTIEEKNDWQPIARGAMESVEIVADQLEPSDTVKGGSQR